MEKHCILVRYGEIYLKGKNKFYFENVLLNNIKKMVEDVPCLVHKISGRYLVTDYDPVKEKYLLSKIQKVFGVYSVSPTIEIDTNLEAIRGYCGSIKIKENTFKIDVNRADKLFPMNSVELACDLGGYVLDNNPHLKVKLVNPEKTVFVDLRENGKTYIFYDVIKAVGGIPVGTSGRGMLLLSGGIDSPVAGYLMAKRGLSLDAVYYHSFPYTGESAKEKVKKLAKILSGYSGNLRLHVVSFTKIQEAIHENCAPEYMITIMRRFMMRIARRLCEENRLKCIVTGESLAQVASQTVESMTVTGGVVTDMPVFRPLIGQDKEETIILSKAMGAYDTSILPYQDCCTVFLPEHPVIKPKLERVEREEKKLDIDALVEGAMQNIEVVDFK